MSLSAQHSSCNTVLPNDIPRHRRVPLLVQRSELLSTANESSEQQYIKIDVPGRLGNDGGAGRGGSRGKLWGLDAQLPEQSYLRPH